MAATLMSTSSCILEPLVQAVEFKSGAVYRGALLGRKRSGRGTFSWPSGLQYTGEFVGDKRHGYGVQLWSDGSKYEGEFREDLRHGEGRHVWGNGEVYEGEYVADKKHGKGTYSWPSGASFTGRFDCDEKEGVGVYVLSEGERFEGMYHCDVRDGEGVMTYLGGREDVGMWMGMKLLRLKFVVHEATFDRTASHPLGSGRSLDTPDLKSRGKCGPKGPLEVASEELIEAAANGNTAKVTAILRAGGVHVDVVDKNGHSALFAAAIHSHPEVINVLLDSGADVNRLDSAGISALTACHHLLYSPFPGVKELLKLLPLSKPDNQSHSSSSPSTEYTLHTSDFLSTPPNTPYPASPPPTAVSPHSHGDLEECAECKGLCKAKSLAALPLSDFHTHNSDSSCNKTERSRGTGLTKVRSYPLLNARAEKKVRFVSMGTLMPNGAKLRPGDNVALFTSFDGPSLVVSKTVMASQVPEDQEVLEKKVFTEENNFLLPTIHCSLPTPTDSEQTSSSQNHSRAPSNDHGESSVSGSLGSLLNSEGLPPTASDTRELLGVSVMHSDFFLKSSGQVEDSDQPSKMSHESCDLPSEFGNSSESEESTSSDEGEENEPYKLANGISPPFPSADLEENQNGLLLSGINGSISPPKSPEPSSVKLTPLGNAKPFPSPVGNGKLTTPLTRLLQSELHSSSVFSSTRYGPIVSAAQSTTLSCGDGDHLEELSEAGSSPTPLPVEAEGEERPVVFTPESSIALLLRRGANPDMSLHPLPPLFYAIRAGDLEAVERLLERGASIDLCLPKELGGQFPLHAAVTLPSVHSAAIVEALLNHGADPNCEERVEGEAEERGGGDTPTSSDAPHENDTEGKDDSEEGEDGSTNSDTVAGDNPGLHGFTPLHSACAMSTADTKVLLHTVPAVVEVLLSYGAGVNQVAQGHSPLSLAILNGLDLVVEILLKHGADPNLPLGRGVGSALCALTTHSAHKNRDSRSTLAVVGKLLKHRADILLPIKVRDQWDSGTVVDFAHEAFDQDKRLACLRYIALNKSERMRYKAARKLIQHLVNLLRCKALENISKESRYPALEPGYPGRHLHRTMSAVNPRPLHFAAVYQKPAPRRDVQSAGGMPRRGGNPLSLSLPERTLRTALEDVSRVHGGNGGLIDLNLRSGTQRKLPILYSGIEALFPWNHSNDSGNDRSKLDGADHHGQKKNPLSSEGRRDWTLLSFCYECGRSTGVRLVRCKGCGAVCYCSHSCRDDNWKKGHREECTGAQVKMGPLSQLKHRQKQRRNTVELAKPSDSLKASPSKAPPKTSSSKRTKVGT